MGGKHGVHEGKEKHMFLVEQPEKKTELWEYEGKDRRKILKEMLNTIRRCEEDLSFLK